VHEGLRAGAVDVVVGRHALLTEDVRFASLGAVVIDEQHRFGVEQRAALRPKAETEPSGERCRPDLLVMTATPIPRTAAMVVFGDLDVTELDESAEGRAPIQTVWRGRRRRTRTDGLGQQRCARGGSRTPGLLCVPARRGIGEHPGQVGTQEKERLEQTVLRPVCRSACCTDN